MKKDITFALVVWLHYSPAFWADGKSMRIDLLFFFHDTWNARHILLYPRSYLKFLHYRENAEYSKETLWKNALSFNLEPNFLNFS